MSDSTQPQRILLVDDNVDASFLLALILRHDGYECREAHSGKEALQVFDEYLPDVVILDIGLPGMNGFEVCKKIRETPHGRNVCLIALTGYGATEHRQKAMEAGFDTHLLKPADPNLLIETIRALR